MSFLENHRGVCSMMMSFLHYLNTALPNYLRKDDPAWQGKKKELNDNFVWMLSPITKKCRISNSFATPKEHKRKHQHFPASTLRLNVNFNFAAPCNIKDLSNDHSPTSVEQESDQSECDSQNEYDSDFIMQEKSCNESDNEDSNFEPKPSKVTFIVFWSSLLMLLQRYLHPTCFLPAKIENFSLKGCQLIVSFQCSNDHTSFWKSQPDCNRFSVGNLMSAAAVIFSTNTYQRIVSFFQLANSQWFRKQVTMKFQKK